MHRAQILLSRVNGMALQKGDFISLRYTGRAGANIFDTTDEEDAKEGGIHNPQAKYGPATVRLGSHHVILGFEDELIGKEVGDEGTVEVPPEKAFGAHDKKHVKSFSTAKFSKKPERGMEVKVDGNEGTVVDVIGKRAVVDFNHPLAGMTLQYSYKILGKVEDPIEQIRGLIRLFIGRTDIGVTIADDTVELALPPAILMYDKRWMTWRGTLVREIFEYFPDIRKIVMKETFERPEEMGVTPGTEEKAGE